MERHIINKLQYLLESLLINPVPSPLHTPHTQPPPPQQQQQQSSNAVPAVLTCTYNYYCFF